MKYLLCVLITGFSIKAFSQTKTHKQLFDSCVHNYVLMQILLHDPNYTVEQFHVALNRYDKYRVLALNQLYTAKAKDAFCDSIVAESKKYYKF